MKYGKSTYKTVSGAACRRLGMRTMTHASPAKAPRRSLRRGLNRKGAIGVAFAIGVTAVLGMGALATEAGVWLYQRRSAQDAADTAAYAGMVRFSMTTDANAKTAAAVAAATQVARINGFQNVGGPLSAPGDTRVRVQVGFVMPPATPGGPVGDFQAAVPGGSSANAVRVEIEQVQRSGFAQLISNTPPTAWGGAVAIMDITGPACMLSIPPPGTQRQDNINGQTNIGSSTSVTARNCIIASNYLGEKSINILGNPGEAVTVGGLRASGNCYNCDRANALGGYVSSAPTTENPYADLDNRTLNPMPGRSLPFTVVAPTCAPEGARQIISLPRNTSPTPASVRVVELNGDPCSPRSGGPPLGTMQLGGTQTLRLEPGTYYFHNTSLQMTSAGAIIECPNCERGRAGVTLVFTGSAPSTVGGIDITGGSFTLIAPGDEYGAPPALDGIVIYRDNYGAVSNHPDIKIRGNTGSRIGNTLFGGVYAPTAGVEVEGTMSVNVTADPNCTSIIAGEITFRGNSTANIDACESNGTAVAQTRYVRLVR